MPSASTAHALHTTPEETVKNSYQNPAVPQVTAPVTGFGPAPAANAPPVPTFTVPVKNYGLTDKLQVAYTANVAVESRDVQQATERAELLFREEGGFILGSQYQRGHEAVLPTATDSGH